MFLKERKFLINTERFGYTTDRIFEKIRSTHISLRSCLGQKGPRACLQPPLGRQLLKALGKLKTKRKFLFELATFVQELYISFTAPLRPNIVLNECHGSSSASEFLFNNFFVLSPLQRPSTCLQFCSEFCSFGTL